MPRHCFHYFFLASAYNIFDKGSVVRVELFLVWPITSCKNRSEIQANLSKNSNPEILQIPMYPMFLSQVTMCCVCRKASPAAEADLLLVTLSFLERETPFRTCWCIFFLIWALFGCVFPEWQLPIWGWSNVWQPAPICSFGVFVCWHFSNA